MTQPVSIDHDTRRITFQLGRVIPVKEARADLHRLLDLALDALEVSRPPQSTENSDGENCGT